MCIRDSMQNIRTSVFFGDLVRNLHRWGAHLMVFTVTLHMARVFYTGAYKPPREFNWVVGVILLFLTLGLSFTGYLLRWYVLHVLALPFVLVLFLSVHFWRIRKDGGISGPL